METKEYTAAEQAETISKLISILHTFTPQQLADFASAAQDLIAQQRDLGSVSKEK